MRATCLTVTLLLIPLASTKADPSPLNQVLRGEQVFQSYCARCHGRDGDGNGPLAVLYRRMAAPKPSDFRVGYFAERPEGYLRKIIRDGGAAHRRSGYMPPFGEELSEAQIEDVIAFIRHKALSGWKRP